MFRHALGGDLRYMGFGGAGRQVRDILHSFDLVNAFWHFFGDPKIGAVYNMGGGRHSNCSVLEAIGICQEMARQPLSHTLSEESRSGDHIWWIGDVRRFQADYPDWLFRYDQHQILQEIHDALAERHKASRA